MSIITFVVAGSVIMLGVGAAFLFIFNKLYKTKSHENKKSKRHKH